MYSLLQAENLLQSVQSAKFTYFHEWIVVFLVSRGGRLMLDRLTEYKDHGNPANRQQRGAVECQ